MKVFFAFLSLGAIVIILISLNMAYEWFRKRYNKPRMGQMGLFNTRLKRDDYICFGDKVLRFSHIAGKDEIINVLRPPLNGNRTYGGELAFYDPHSIGYVYYDESVMKDCKFIYGKYGLEWAINDEFVLKAEVMVKNAY